MSNNGAEKNSEHTLVLSSEYTSSGITGSNTDFTVHLKNSSHGSLMAAQLVYAQIPNCFDNVREGLNSFNIYESSTDTTTTITVPPGRYTESELIDKIREVFFTLYPTSPEHVVPGWINMEFSNQNPFSTNSRFLLSVDRFIEVVEEHTFDPVFLQEPTADMLQSPHVFPSNYISPIITAVPPVIPTGLGDSYVGMWMTVKQTCTLKGAFLPAMELNPNFQGDPNNIIKCRIFKMTYGNVPGVNPGVLPPSDFDVPDYASLRPYTDQFTLSLTYQTQQLNFYNTVVGNENERPNVVMEPGYYFIGHIQSSNRLNNYIDWGINFNVAGYSEVDGVTNIHTIGTDATFIQTLFVDSDPKKQPPQQNIYPFQFSSPLQAGQGLTSVNNDNEDVTNTDELFFSTTTSSGVDISAVLGFVSVGDILYLQDSADSANNQSWMVTGPPMQDPHPGFVFPVTLADSNGLGTTGWNNDQIVYLVGGWTPVPYPGIKMSEMRLGENTSYLFDGARGIASPQFLSAGFTVRTMGASGSVILTSPTAGSPDDLLTHVLGFTNGQSITTQENTYGSIRAASPSDLLGPQTVFIRSTCFGEAKALGPHNGEFVDTNIMGIVSLANVPW